MSRREIKFRAWDINEETMIYSSEEDAKFILESGSWSVKFVREKNFDNEGIEIDAPVYLESDDIELMQYTGLKDKNGKDIYDGDILSGHSDGNVKVEWAVGSWECIFSDEGNISIEEMCVWFGNNSEVVGNIYENPELIKL